MGRIHEVRACSPVAVIDVEKVDRKAVVERVSRRVDDPRVREQAFDETDVEEVVGPLVRDARRARGTTSRQRGEIAIGQRVELRRGESHDARRERARALPGRALE